VQVRDKAASLCGRDAALRSTRTLGARVTSNATARACAALVGLLAASVGLADEPRCVRNELGAFEDIVCAVSALRQAERELEVIYVELMTQLDEKGKRALEADQKSWVTFRDHLREGVIETEGDGSAGKLAAAFELEQETRRRIRELHARMVH